MINEKRNMFRIGEFSRIAQVTVKTLRYYDEIGLLKPAAVDRYSGYRFYVGTQLSRLNRILVLKDLGFTLEQIAQLIHDDLSSDEIRGMLRMRRIELQQQILTAEVQLSQVEFRLSQLEQEMIMPIHEVVVKKIEPQKVASIRDVVPDYSSQTILWEELSKFLLEKQVKAQGPSMTLYFDSEYQEKDVSLEVATPVKILLEGNGRVRFRELEGVEQMACLLHEGSFTTLSQTYGRLLDWIDTNGYRIVGPNRELYLQCPMSPEEAGLVYEGYLQDDENQYLTELQFPVKKID
jgi:effector-binding domain-containing protein